jgi:hypothetical protein
MTAIRNSIEITQEERTELIYLFYRIKTDLTSSSTDELERFTDLFAKTLIGKSDSAPTA